MSRLLCLALALLAGTQPATGDPVATQGPVVALLIDDMGYRLEEGEAALGLPGPLAYSFLPYTPHARALAEQARALGREILLHLPMEAERDNHLLGPGALLGSMDRARIEQTLEADLAALPPVIGVNNHMGSRLTREPMPMHWLMEGLRRHGGLIFIDSRTTAATVAATVARQYGLAQLSRDVFLDNRDDPAAIREQFRRWLRRAWLHGHSLAIAHPRPATLAVLALELPRLRQHGVRLVSLEEFYRYKSRRQTWQSASSSPWPKAVKSSRPLP
ncbi:MAG: divergent polysaccharide deacetylase family protein [Gammaproteobacteria bacterium]|nr:MAG: divergent polysaccharide deacetylase family protein [Gammaproteobacteria bacterium]